MLEEILKSINSNLERIAKALEADTADALAEIVHETAQQFKQDTYVSTTQIQNQQPAMQEVQVPQVQTLQPAIPQTAIPTTPLQQSFTQEQLANAMANAVSAGKMNIIQNILHQFNVQALTQINPSDYNKLATMLKEAGVEV